MKRYVLLDALVAEIERRMQLRKDSYKKYKQLSDFITFEELEYFHDEFIPTLEVKEDVSLDKACEWIKQHIEDEKYKIPDEESYRHGLHYDYFETNMFINDFCKAMTNEKRVDEF